LYYGCIRVPKSYVMSATPPTEHADMCGLADVGFGAAPPDQVGEWLSVDLRDALQHPAQGPPGRVDVRSAAL
jgi:hypothetical protein